MTLAGVAPGPELAAGMPGDRELPGTEAAWHGGRRWMGDVAVFGRTLGMMFASWVGSYGER